MLKIKRLSCIFLIILIQTGCSTPANIKEKVSKYLTGSCSELFNNGSIGAYQQVAQALGTPRQAFALAIDSQGNQVCAISQPRELIDNTCLFDCQATWAQTEALAVSKCEDYKISHNLTGYSPCRIFARNNEIVWDMKTDKKNDFQ